MLAPHIWPLNCNAGLFKCQFVTILVFKIDDFLYPFLPLVRYTISPTIGPNIGIYGEATTLKLYSFVFERYE